MTTIRWYRSWPKKIPSNRVRRHPHVVDNLPRLLIENYDYMTCELPRDRPGFCLLEWDVAFESWDRIQFARQAAADRETIMVAPYNLYPLDGLPECAHRDEYGDPIIGGTTECASFGLGCVYLPRDVIGDFIHDAGDLGLTDATLSRYARATGIQVHVDWSFRPAHLSGD